MNRKKILSSALNFNGNSSQLFQDCRYQDQPAVSENIGPDRSAASRKTRLVLYSHDTMGLGHIRRNLLIAQALQLSPHSFDILLITGAQEAGQFVMPKDTDRVILPCLFKNSDGGYRSRHLNLELADIIDLRSQIIESAVRSFDPDLVIVDNVARGPCGELDRTLEHLRGKKETKLVLGMRDIKDEPSLVAKEWKNEGFENVIDQYYEEIWVYGDRNVYDVTSAYSLKPSVADKVRFTGYLDQKVRMAFDNEQGLSTRQLVTDLHHMPYVLCMVGGGQDGLLLAETFLNTELEPGLHGVLLTGPHMSKKERSGLLELANASTQMQAIDFVSEPTLLLKDARAVVSMGGYNAVSEILSFNKSALIVPRVTPRREQLIRAEKLSERGVIDYMRPEELDSGSLGKWITRAVRVNSINTNKSIDMDGLNRIQALLTSLLPGIKQKNFNS